MYKIRVFDQLVSDSDPNLTNVLIGEDWKIWRIDFTRAFRINTDLKNPERLGTLRPAVVGETEGAGREYADRKNQALSQQGWK